MEIPGPDGKPLFIALHSDVYRPSDDTFLLAKAVHEHAKPGLRFLEVGCGAGFVSVVAAKAGCTVTCTDANPHAVALAAHNAKQNGLHVTAVETDLLAGLAGPFDLVAFNPPYLPTDPDERLPGVINLAFDGGRDGNETVLRFASQLTALRPLPPVILVVHSSLSDPKALAQVLAKAGYRNDVVAEQTLDFEKLTVQRFTLLG